MIVLKIVANWQEYHQPMGLLRKKSNCCNIQQGDNYDEQCQGPARETLIQPYKNYKCSNTKNQDGQIGILYMGEEGIYPLNKVITVSFYSQ